MSTDAAERDYTPWRHPVRRWPSVEDFAQGLPGAGIPAVHVIGMSPGETLDILVRGDPRTVEGGLPVFFNGAVPGRRDKLGPFFSGARVGPRVASAYVSVSDPSVDRCPPVSLAWYAGNEHSPVTRTALAALRAMSAAWGKELVLVGGSGGGYASLRLGAELGDLASAFVWNPQTDILAYSKHFVDEYLLNCYPTTFRESVDGAEWKQQYRRLAEEAGISLSLLDRPGTAAAPRRVLYLQNRTDWHLDAHALPFMAAEGLRPLGQGTYHLDPQHVLQVAEWGTGHEPPSSELIIDHLTSFMDPSSNALDVARAVIDDPRTRRDHLHRAPLDLRPVAAEIEAQAVTAWDTDGATLKLSLGRVPIGYGGLRFGARQDARRLGMFQEDPEFQLGQYGVSDHHSLTLEARDGVGNHLFGLAVAPRTRPTRVFVYGSCVSRDAFEFDHGFEIVEYVARSPLISAFSPPLPSVPEGADPSGIDSSFQRRMVMWDWEKKLPELLVGADHDYLLIDLIDERIPLFRHEGTVAAYSLEAQRSGLQVPSTDLWDARADDYLEHWTKALDRLFAVQAPERTIVNQAYWASRDSQGTDLTGRFPVVWANSVLDSFYEALRDHPGVQFLSYEPELLVAASGHRWGLSPFHYVDGFYRHFLEQLDVCTHDRNHRH